MKLECVKDRIKNASLLVEKMTGKNISLPILKNIILISKGKTLTLKATNLDVGIEYEIPAKIFSEGVVAVPGAILNNVLSNIYNNDIISLELINENLLISTKNSSTLIKTISHEDFPIIPRVSDGEKLIISSSKFINGLKSVWYSASVSDIKPEISSIYIYPDDGNLVFVATDSFRLSEKKIKEKDGDFDGILIPFKNISDIIRSFENNSEDIEFTFNKNQTSFYSNGIYLTTRLIEGIFPDYKQIMPKEFKTEVIVLKQDFGNVLKMANIFSDKFNQITLKVDISNKVFEVESKNQDTGENTTSVEASLSGEDITMSFNYKYISDCFQSIPEDSLILRFNGVNKPMVIKGVSDKTFTYLIMPMNR